MMRAQGGAICNRPLTNRVAPESERRLTLQFYPLPNVIHHDPRPIENPESYSPPPARAVVS